MLVLSRRKGEAVIIAGNVRVEVVEVRGDKVRLGITAPESIRVDREEVHLSRAATALSPEGGRESAAGAETFVGPEGAD